VSGFETVASQPPQPPKRPTRDDYVVWRQATTRWADDDVYGHMNNARYFELIDTAVNAHLAEATGVDIRALPAVGVVAEVSCRYFREVGYPDPIDLGLAVERLGTSSIVYRIGIFQGEGDEAAAEGRFVHVYVEAKPRGSEATDRKKVDRQRGRPTTPIPDVIRAAVEPLVVS
jgi:acyl-CoA thioester hydrolase